MSGDIVAVLLISQILSWVGLAFLYWGVSHHSKAISQLQKLKLEDLELEIVGYRYKLQPGVTNGVNLDATKANEAFMAGDEK